MSYNMSLKVKIDGTDKYATVEPLEANITYKVRKMIQESTGLTEWDINTNLGLAKDVMQKIEQGELNLGVHPERYKKYELPSGCGTIVGTINFFRELERDWWLFCGWNEDIADYVYLWVN